MAPFTTYDKDNRFQLEFNDYSGTSFDNKEAMGVRLTILFVEEGSGIALINERSIPYIGPCIFCISEQEHVIIAESYHSKVKAIFFHPSIINSALNYESIRKLPDGVPDTVMQDRETIRFFVNRNEEFGGKFVLGPLSGKKVSILMDAIHRQITDQNMENWPCRSRSFIMEILFLLDNIYFSENFRNETYVETLDEDFCPILLYIYNNYDKKMTVADLTDKFHISKSTFSKKFQENIGEPFLVYLNKLRITMAATMLRDTKLPVNEIMYRVGFTDNVHFLRTFKKYINLSPTNYRDKYNWM